LKELKEFLTSIDWKNIQNIYNQNVELETKIKQNDIEIMKLEDESKRLEEYKMQKSNLAVKLEQINKQKDEIEIQIKELDKQEAELKQSSLELNYQEILEIEEVNNEMETNLNNIKNLVDDFNDTQLKVKILQEEEKMIANLYQIFSKELLLIVLQDSLPTLSEIINAFLAQVVDYQISF
jgi:DNA repair exonuclease SbcCD ATPase subunit